MSTVADATTRAAAARDELAWHGLTAEEACTRLGVDPIVFIGRRRSRQRTSTAGSVNAARPSSPPSRRTLREAGGGTRTLGRSLTRRVLYQLSYSGAPES